MAIYNSSGESLTVCYDSAGNELNIAYDASGNVIYQAVEPEPPVPDYTNFTISDFMSVFFYNAQAFDIYGTTLFQFRGETDLLNIYNTTNATAYKSNLSVTSGHGNSASFSDEFYNPVDSFPLIYVSANTANPPLVYVNRVTLTTAELVKTLKFPAFDETGYWADAVFDWDADIAYTLGYSEDNITTDDDGNNTVIVTKWDMSNLTDNGDGTYSPAFISRYERDFIYVMQGKQYRDGLIWMGSGYNDGVIPQMIYAIDAETGELIYTIPTDMSIEIEGLTFIDDYHIVAGFWRGTYKLITFGEKTASS